MEPTILFSSLSLTNWAWLAACGVLVGMSKAGVKGLGMLAVPILAVIFGGKVSAGLLLPILVIADFFAVLYYNRHADWSYIWKLLPPTIIGLFVGLAVGAAIDDELFKKTIGFIIIFSLVIMVLIERWGMPKAVTGSWLFGAVFGLIGGFSTMIGNAAGPIMAVYLLAVRLPKNNFIGTSAWFFLIVNLIKVPLHALVWHTITFQTLLINALAIPAIALGIYMGILIVHRIPERAFRYFVMGITLVAAIRLLI